LIIHTILFDIKVERSYAVLHVACQIAPQIAAEASNLYHPVILPI
jgi:hypothetical protein